MNNQQQNQYQLLSKVSQRIKDNQQVLSKLNHFYQSAMKPNSNILKIIQPANNYQPINKQTNISLKQNKSNESLIPSKSNINQYQKKVYQIQRQIPIKQNLGCFGIVLTTFLIVFVIAFSIDFYFELQNQIQLKTKEVSQCYQDYQENNCISPVDALIQECSKLQFCASRDPQSILKLSQVFIKTFVSLISIITQHLQVSGMIFVGVLILIYFYRPTMYQVEKVSKYE